MREIKFRWLNEDNEMEYRSLESMCQWDKVYDLGEDYRQPNTEVMQYIGLKDKNDKEIYEGDIIKWKTPDWISNKKGIDEIIFDDGMFGIVNRRFGTSEMVKVSWLITEVIGNIYQNPELLKKD